MARMIANPEWNPSLTQPLRATHDYDYPQGLDLRPGGELSKTICTEVMRSCLESRHVMSQRYSTWKKLDRNLNAFMPRTEEEDIIKAQDPRRPVAVVVPASFATLETFLSYIMGVFMSDEFLVPYYGVGPEDVYGAQLMSHLVQQQAEKGRYELALHTHWRDALVYGFGVLTPRWSVERNPGYELVPQMETGPGGELVQVGVERQIVQRVTWEGSQLLPIDPYDYLPDINVPIHEVDRYEYGGWIELDNRISLLSREAEDGEGLFNCKYLDAVRRKGTLSAVDSGRSTGVFSDKGGVSGPVRDTNLVDITCQYRWLVPKEWKLGDGEEPELWFFRIGQDEIVLQAEHVDSMHGKMPLVIAAPDTDGYSVTPIGRMEVIWGMQEVVDWLFDTHMQNVRKALNDMLIVDPFKINMNDLLTPGPGKIIRTRRSAWGSGVDNCVQQLRVEDVTAGHLDKVSSIIDLIRNTSAAVDSVQGVMRSGPERVSAEESRNVRMSALGRLQRIAKLIYAQSHRVLGTLLAANNTQYMSEDTYVRISGETQILLQQIHGVEAEVLEGRLRVSPLDLCAHMDVRPLDLSTRSPEMASTWLQLYQLIPGNPELVQTLDSTRIFLHIARMLGERNAADFIRKGTINPQIVPDDQAADMAASGEVTPI